MASATNESAMSSEELCPAVRWQRWAVLWAGWLLPQVFLFWPAMLGQTVLVPADILASPKYYLPGNPKYAHVAPRDEGLADLVLIAPAAREFCAAEFRAGRIPLWQPANYAGAPFAVWPKFSPFELPYVLFSSPFTLVWMQVLQALCAGSGLYVFLRRAVALPFWPAAVASWCFPLLGFFVVWQGYPVTAPVCWLPWLLWSVDGAIRHPFGWSSLGVAAVTGLLLLSGQSDVGGLVLLTSGLYALWQIGTTAKASQSWRPAFISVGGVASGWVIGFCLAAPYFLTLYEYSKTGARMQARAAGVEERPPVGVSALPAVLLPNANGTSRRGWIRTVRGSQLESSSGAYAGLIATLWLAPLAWNNRRRRSQTLFWTTLAVVALGWQLNVPGLVNVFRWPLLNMLSYSRWVFATGLAWLVLAAIGMECLSDEKPLFRPWFFIPVALTVAFGIWCFATATTLPDAVRVDLPEKVRAGGYRGLTQAHVSAIQLNFTVCYQIGAVLSLVTLAGWGATIRGGVAVSRAKRLLPIVLLGELLWFASQDVRDAEPSLYFPRVEALEQLARQPRARILGLRTLPPNLNQSHGLWDIRGYDAVDPNGLVKLFEAIRDPNFPHASFAKTQWFVPKIERGQGQFRLPPMLDMLNVGYFLVREPPPQQFEVVAHSDDYWALKNENALPRAFVPRRVVSCVPDDAALHEIARAEFDPRDRAFVSGDLPALTDCSGRAEVVRETPVRVELEADMHTAGVVILSDLWDAGWQARLDGHLVPIHRANVALRGVSVPAGRHRIELTYCPNSFVCGLWLACGSSLVCVLWTAGLVWQSRHIFSSFFAE